jgi:hypothetical protein
MSGMTGVQLAGSVEGQWQHLPMIRATDLRSLVAVRKRLCGATSPDLVRLKKPFSQNVLARAITESMNRMDRAAEREVVSFRPRSDVEKASSEDVEKSAAASGNHPSATSPRLRMIPDRTCSRG